VGNRLATTAKYLRGAAGIDMGTTIKCRSQCFCVEPELRPCIHKKKLHPNIYFFASAAQKYIHMSKKTAS
jgi:hypothetical protein